MLSTDGVEGAYRTAYNDRRYDGKRIPPAAAAQQLLAAWKVLWKFSEVLRIGNGLFQTFSAWSPRNDNYYECTTH